jgi:hypothetical protein
MAGAPLSATPSAPANASSAHSNASATPSPSRKRPRQPERDFLYTSSAAQPPARHLRTAPLHVRQKLLAYRPTKEDLHGFTPPADDAGLIDHEVIPLSFTLADAVITQLRAAATEVREAIDQARRA